MKQGKQLIKVVAVLITGNAFMGRNTLKTSTSRGIKQLKRGVTQVDFIKAFMAERGIDTYGAQERSQGNWVTSPIMTLNENPPKVMTFHFVKFDSEELGFHAKDLTPHELERDMKTLKKVLYG